MLNEGKKVYVGQENFHNTTNLFAKLLLSASEYTHRQGYWYEYRDVEEEVNCLCGKINFSSTLKQNLLISGKAICLVDEFGINNLPNQILKAALKIILKSDNLDLRYESSLYSAIAALEIVDDIKLQERHFRNLSFTRHYFHYYLLMNLCELVFDNYLPDPHTKGKHTIKELIKDEVQMRMIFQNFVKNFYRQEQQLFSKVKSEKLDWDVKDSSSDDLRFLPSMETDITLSSAERTLIIDTKYVKKAIITGRFGNETLSSEHLYQLTNYLDHKAKKLEHLPEGMLLYPSVSKSLRLQYTLKGKKVFINTIDLSKPWEDIHNELLSFIAA